MKGTIPVQSGLYWWRDCNLLHQGWSVVHVFDDRGRMRYTFLGTEKSVALDQIATCEWGPKLTPPPTALRDFASTASDRSRSPTVLVAARARTI